MIQDYQEQVTQVDGTHIEEFVFNVDWNEFSPATPKDKISEERYALFHLYNEAISSNSEINIHFHTFEPHTMVELLKQSNSILPLNGGSIDFVMLEPNFPTSQQNGFLVIAKVNKPGVMPNIKSHSEFFLPGAVKFKLPENPISQPAEYHENNFPEESYLKLHSDVAAAVNKGQFKSGYAHFCLYGRKEGRRVY